ncbi:MAG: lipid A export permease/ATP-binding protein MsbA [Burkholderiaceae bacterium]|nr:lipid A export permease/ATP-binding protein MsbA [Burkholderiaceae bacterium]
MQTFKQRIKRILPYFASSRWGIVVAILASVVGAATEPVLPALMQPLLDKGFQAGGIPLWLVPIVIIGLFTIRGAAVFVAKYSLSWAANGGILVMRAAMFEHLLAAQPTLFSRHSASSLTNTLVYEVQGGANQLVHSVLGLVRDSLTLVAMLSYLLWLNWKLTLFVAVLIPSVGVVMRVLSKRLHRLTVAGQTATDQLAYVVEENVLAWRIVRLHGAQQSESTRFAKSSAAMRRLAMKSVAAASTMTPVTQILAACAMSAVIVVALWQSTTAGTSVGAFASFVTAMLMVITPIKNLSEVAAPITRGLASIERGVKLIDESPLETGGTHDPGRARGAFELRDVTLRYKDEQATAALERVTLTIPAGESVALVGPSGAGKSSLINLLARFLEPSDGTITLDGVPLADWDVKALRRQFALVSQDVVLFNETVAANVCLGAPFDRERVNDALRSANLLDFVATLPDGIDSTIGHNGSELSGGQRQRMAIARAIYKDAPILILDEATSALDSESERQVQAALDVLMRGRTTIVIAHRLSTIEGADRIVALEAGRVVEQGPHDQLLAQGGLYARLHKLQFRS